MAEQLGQVARRVPAATAASALSVAMTLYNVLETRRRLLALPKAELTDHVSELVLVPANTGLTHWYFWNVCTAHFADVSLVKAVLFAAALFQLSVKLESGWGSRGYVVYLLVCTTIVGFACSFAMLMLYFSKSWEDYFYESLICGQAGVLVAVAVGNVRLDVDDRLLHTTWHTRLALLPVLLAYSVVWAVDKSFGLGFVFDLGFAWVSLLVSYLLTRNFDFTQEASMCAPRTLYADDPFAVHVFFPAPLQPFVSAIATVCDVFLMRVFGCCLRRTTPAAAPAGHGASYGAALGMSPDSLELGGAPVRAGLSLGARKASNPIAERRRARALKALDAKLAQMSREPEVALDDLDEAEPAEAEAAEPVPAQQEQPPQQQTESSSDAAETSKPDQD